MRNCRLPFVWCVVFPVLMTPFSQAQEVEHEQYVYPWRTAWTYGEAAHWSDLDPEYEPCNTGKQQSPVDIEHTQKAGLPPLTFESKNAPLRYVVNNRYTIRVNYHAGNGNFLLVGDKRYELIQFHFHHPSEEHIGGKVPYPMEIHLMYQAADKSVAGVAVFLQPGSANSTVEKLWEHMPKSEGQEEVSGVGISPAGLLPSEQVHSYYMYMGSISAPPCTEGVAWFILRQPVQISSEQIEAFAKLYPDDARPVQPLNGRVVKESR